MSPFCSYPVLSLSIAEISFIFNCFCYYAIDQRFKVFYASKPDIAVPTSHNSFYQTVDLGAGRHGPGRPSDRHRGAGGDVALRQTLHEQLLLHGGVRVLAAKAEGAVRQAEPPLRVRPRHLGIPRGGAGGGDGGGGGVLPRLAGLWKNRLGM